MIHSNPNNRHLTQVAYKVIVLIFTLLIITFVFMTIPNSTDVIFYGMILIVLVGILFFQSYKRDFSTFSNELHYVIEQDNVFASIVNTAYNALLITDGNKIVYHNKAARMLFRKSNRFIETCDFSDLIYHADLQKVMEYIEQNIEADSLVVRINTFNNFENDFIYCQASLKKHFFKQAEQYIISLIDITEYFADSNYKLQTISLYENTFNKLPQLLCLFDAKGRLVFNNQHAKSTYSDSNYLDIIEYDINKNLLRTGFEVAISGDTFKDTRIISRKFAGQDVGVVEEWGNITLAPVHSDDNTNFVAYIVDNITPLKHTITTLEAKLQVYSLEFNSAHLATLLWDANGDFSQANHIFYNMFGVTNEALKEYSEAFTINNLPVFFAFKEIVFLNHKHNITNRYVANTLPLGLQKLFDKVNTTQDFEMYICIDKKSKIFTLNENYSDTQSQQTKHIFAEDKDIWLNVHVHPLVDTNGQFYATAINFTDASETIDAQNRYDVHFSYLKAIANNFYAGIIFIIDASYQIMFWGGEEKIKQKINISNDLWMRNSVHLSAVPELEKYRDNIQLSLKGNYSKLTINIFNELYDFQFFPVRNDNEAIEFCMGVGFNVTERSNFEKQLLLQKHFLDKIFAESQIPQVILDINGKIDRANIQYYQIAGVTAEKLYQTSVYDEDSWLHKDAIIQNFNRTLNGETTWFEVTEAKKFTFLEEDVEADEYLYVLSCKSYPICDNNNNVTHIIFNFIDISDTRMLVESMRRSNAMNNIVTANYPAGILVILNKYKRFILFEGEEEMQALELNKMEIVGKHIDRVSIPVIDAIKPQIKQALTASKQKNITAQKINFDFAVELIKDNKFPVTLDYEANIVPIFGANDILENVFICINNISNRKQLEKTILEFNLTLEQEVVQRTTELKETTMSLEMYVTELKSTQQQLLTAQQQLSVNLSYELELNKMKSRFISLMSHEFRTPLTVIQTYIYLMDSYYEMQMKEKFDMAIGVIIDYVGIMTKLLDNILLLDKSSLQVLSFEGTNVVNVIQNAIGDVLKRDDVKQRVNVNTTSDNIAMITDVLTLQKVVVHLLSNAVKYSPKNTEVNINIKDYDNCITLEIQDFGVGIAEDVLERIFDAFVRSQSTTNISGAGIGLYVTKKCVDILKGKIEFDTAKGRGTTFLITLPKHSNEDIPELNSQVVDFSFEEKEPVATTEMQLGIPVESIEHDKLTGDEDFIISDTGIIKR